MRNSSGKGPYVGFVSVLAVFAGVIVALRNFGLNPTAALAGLGVGGIAVALAPQRTLENVIAGISLILDRALRVGDTLKVGETHLIRRSPR